jgi:hypothetical protein
MHAGNAPSGAKGTPDIFGESPIRVFCTDMPNVL